MDKTVVGSQVWTAILFAQSPFLNTCDAISHSFYPSASNFLLDAVVKKLKISWTHSTTSNNKYPQLIGQNYGTYGSTTIFSPHFPSFFSSSDAVSRSIYPSSRKFILDAEIEGKEYLGFILPWVTHNYNDRKLIGQHGTYGWTTLLFPHSPFSWTYDAMYSCFFASSRTFFDIQR